MTIIYGIKECDTVKKAQKWLLEHAIDFTFHDVRKDGIDGSLIHAWLEKVEASALVNRRSTTWRNLPDETKQNLTDDTIFDLLLASPTLIKRPVLVYKEHVNVGFKADDYRTIFNI